MKRSVRIVWMMFFLSMFLFCSVTVSAKEAKREELPYEIKTKQFVKEVKSKDGLQVLSCKLTYPQIVTGKKKSKQIKQVNHLIEKDAIVRFQKQCNDATEYSNEFINQVYFRNTPSGFLPFTVDITYTITLQNDCCFSFYSTDFVWLGGAHPDTMQYGFAYDLKKGTKLLPEDILKMDSDGVKTYIADQVQQLYEEHPEEFFKEEVEALQKLEFEPKYYITESGITFFFNSYEIAPYARGIVNVELSHREHPERFR